MLNTVPQFSMPVWVCEEHINWSQLLNDSSSIFSLELYGHLTTHIPTCPSCSSANSHPGKGDPRKEPEQISYGAVATGRTQVPSDIAKGDRASRHFTDEQLAGGGPPCSFERGIFWVCEVS